MADDKTAAATTPGGSNPANDLTVLFDQIAEKIIEQQEAVIGPLAVEQAKRVRRLKINWPQHEVDVSGNPQQAIDELVNQYKELFGQLAVETCKDAVSRFVSKLPPGQVPKTLQ